MKAAAILWVAWLVPLTALAQEWKVYRYPDVAFAVQLPVPPDVEKSTFRTSSGVSLPMTHYVARQDGITYTLDVVDFSSANADGKSAMVETERSFRNSGRVRVALDAHINLWRGRELSLSGTDGSRSAIAIFFVNKHLYTLVGRSLPPDAMARSGDAIRFQQSLQFIVVDENGGFGPPALAACQGKSVGAAVQLDTPRGPVAATCTLVAQPNPPTDSQTPSPQTHTP